jgi:hypothetical protein
MEKKGADRAVAPIGTGFKLTLQYYVEPLPALYWRKDWLTARLKSNMSNKSDNAGMLAGT